MKFFLALTSLLSMAAAMTEISTSSRVGRNLLASARRLEQNGENDEFMYGWVADYSIKFQGCHHIKQWNDEADEENDVKIETKRLIRFRLCPSSSCDASKGGGCSTGFGDYVIDMDTFMEAYFEARREEIEWQCENQLQNNCGGCEDNGDDGFDEEICEYQCYMNAGMEECVENNPYEDDEEVQEFNLEEYMQCGQLEVQQNQNQNRKLEEEVQYFVGPYCAEQGGAIHLGVFSDDACSVFSDVSFQSLAGFTLPYSSATGDSLVLEECMSCKEKQDVNEQNNNNNNNDAQDADNVIETCEQLYASSGKCEVNLPSGTVYEQNNNGCNYMEGIKITRADGIIDTSINRPSAVATAFIVFFAMAFFAMAFYVWYLRTRLGVKQNTLL